MQYEIFYKSQLNRNKDWKSETKVIYVLKNQIQYSLVLYSPSLWSSARAILVINLTYLVFECYVLCSLLKKTKPDTCILQRRKVRLVKSLGCCPDWFLPVWLCCPRICRGCFQGRPYLFPFSIRVQNRLKNEDKDGFLPLVLLCYSHLHFEHISLSDCVCRYIFGILRGGGPE